MASNEEGAAPAAAKAAAPAPDASADNNGGGGEANGGNDGKQNKKQQKQQKQQGKKGGNNNNNNNSNKKGGKKNKGKGKGGGGGGPAPIPEPDYVAARIELFEKLKAEADAAAAALPDEPISITLPDGSVKEGLKGKTTPLDIANGISSGFARSVFVAKVDGEYHDLTRPIEGDCSLELFKFDTPEGKHAFWHSSAHVLGQAMELVYGGSLGIGPALDDGFYYDIFLGEGSAISSNDFDTLEATAKKIIKGKQPFERLEVPREVAQQMFAYNPFKLQIIDENIEEGATVTLYRCGKLIDLCRGPHVPHTGKITSLALTKESSAYWKGNADNPVMQRVYGVAFPDKKELAQYMEFLQQAKERDHRRIGVAQELFFFDDLSPGSCFFLPMGARIYNKLIEFIKAQYWKRGYEEVVTPNIYHHKLWITSGHWEKYAENMFRVEVEKELFGVKPMNCPGHCVMFAHRQRSYRELPWRVADFGVLHRNELSGALSGLTRVRRFQQDDAHIFCTVDQVAEEVQGVLDFLQEVYGIFGFTFALKLSTRPENYVGEIEVWDTAEAALSEALDGFGEPWVVDPGDGAFYGPKIDITIHDAMRRSHQCATIQLDFQLPIRFGLKYNDNDGEKTPVIIHRAILGSVERMIAILTENYGGKWPFWLSPRQCRILPISEKHIEFANEVRIRIHDAGFFVEVDETARTTPKKVAVAREEGWTYMLIVGDREVEAGTVNVRLLDAERERGAIPVDELIAEFEENRANYR